MVDALRRAARWVTAEGCVIDIRPTDLATAVEVGSPDRPDATIGDLAVDDERHRRHAAADRALAHVVELGILRLDATRAFAFRRYAASAAELADYVTDKWPHTKFDAATRDRAAAALRARPGGTIWVRQQIEMRKLRPAATPAAARS
jgi:hypothetical protein